MDIFPSKTTINISKTIKTQEYCLRILGYFFIAVVVSSGLYTDFFASDLLFLIPYALLYPHIIYFVGRHVEDQYIKPFYVLKIALDATHTVLVAALLSFPVIPTLLGFLIITFTTLITGGVRLMLPIVSGLLVLTGLIWFVFNPVIIVETPFLMTLMSVIVAGVFICLMSYFVYFQGVKLNQAQRKVQREQEKYQSLLQDLTKYLPAQLCEKILTGKRPAKIVNQRQKMTVFFSDIKGFTELAEELEAEALTDLLNNYLNEMARIALEYGGTIDKFIGDSIMVFFGDLPSQCVKKDAHAAVAMAIAMREHMKTLQREWRAQGITKPLEIRMGINTGYCTVGNFGSDARMDYTIIGREVNLASRLESTAQAGEILISYETYSLTNDLVKSDAKGRVAMKGFSRPIEIFQVVDFYTNLRLKERQVQYEMPGFVMLLDKNSIQSKDGKHIQYALKHANTYFNDQPADAVTDIPRAQ